MVVFKRSTLISTILILFSISGVKCTFEFRNINCTSLDPSFVECEDCYLKSINRTYKYLTVRTKFHKLPLNNFEVHVEILKRFNGYKPFLYDFTAEMCKYFNGHRDPLQKFFYELLSPYSNVNHTCPYNHSIIVEKLPISYLNHRLTSVLPVPEGEYCVRTTYLNAGIQRAMTRVYVSIS